MSNRQRGAVICSKPHSLFVLELGHELEPKAGSVDIPRRPPRGDPDREGNAHVERVNGQTSLGGVCVCSDLSLRIPVTAPQGGASKSKQTWLNMKALLSGTPASKS